MIVVLKGWKRLWVCIWCQKALFSSLPKNNSRATRKMRKEKTTSISDKIKTKLEPQTISGRVAKSSGDDLGMGEKRGHGSTDLRKDTLFEGGGQSLTPCMRQQKQGASAGRRSALVPGFILQKK